MNDPINHPDHYGGGADQYEVIKVIEAWALNFNLGNTIKYIGRHDKKGDRLTDLRKARWYLDREIEILQGMVPTARGREEDTYASILSEAQTAKE